MTYDELTDLCELRHRTLISLAKELDFTMDGLRTSMRNQTLPIKKLEKLCNILNISPNEFFRWKDTSNNVTMFQNGIGNAQIYQEENASLKDQLKIKDEQIKSLLEILKTR